MDLRLQGKTALVTGSTSGIGEAIAVALAAEGVRVAINGRNVEAAERVIAEIGAARAVPALGDLSTGEGVASVAAAAEKQLGHVDILVNNAGQFNARPYDEVAEQDWVETFNNNFMSAVRLSRSLAPAMRERGWGRIVGIGSTAGSVPLTFVPDYSAMKSALLSFSGSLAKSMAGTRVTSNVITSGIVKTPPLMRTVVQLAEAMGGDMEKAERRMMTELNPSVAERMGEPFELAALTAFVCSPLADYITGANLRIDGGMLGHISI
jgi:NAD(P)-dependent dehydrogenase (short-subunit alcohol dehydrogenase family)